MATGMARRGASLDELFDRPYRPGAAFGPRISPLRRWGMFFVLFLLTSVIVTYWYLTDTKRVRSMAQNYLSQLTGGHVEVKNATLSIFEGLRLEGVVVRVDNSKRPDATLFKAGTILIKYNPQSILNGHLEATQIVALDPQVFICEDLDTGHWNWQRAVHEEKATTQSAPGPRMKFPEIHLRNAQLNYSRLRNGQLLAERGLMDIEGSLKPGEDGAFTFTVQSRGEGDSMGPVVEGDFNVYTKAVNAKLLNDFHFGKEIEVMLPEQVRTWWIAHGLSGNLEISKFQIIPANKPQKSRFHIETVLHDVNLHVHPEEWLSHEENARLAAMRQTMASMKALGLDETGFVSKLQSLFDPSVIELTQVAGKFTFTEDGIDFKDLRGLIEHDNLFDISGHINDYSAEAAASITLRGDKVVIPRAPRYLNSMPAAFREIYDHLHPEGNGSLLVQIDRPTPGAKPKVSGRIGINDGNFRFDEFAYPLRRVMGVITFGWDEKSQMERVDVTMQGLGIADGPNKNVPVDVRGFVGPLGHGDPEFDFHVTTHGVTSEPALTAAYPGPAQEALKLFDAPGKGEFPQYHGGFTADVHRPPGPNQKWSVIVDVDLDDARGALTFFPLPVEHLAGKLHITGDHVDLINLAVKKGDSSLLIDGVVRFGKDVPADPHVRVTARNIPIDKDLLAALPKDRREPIEKLGLGGILDVDGKIERAVAVAPSQPGHKKPEDDIGYDLHLKLKNGTLWPTDGLFAATAVSGSIHLTPTQIVLTDMKGMRGKSEVSAGGTINWGDAPSAQFTAAARDLQLDAALYKLLPPTWRGGWDQARPEGTINVNISYTGAIDVPGHKPTTQTTRPADTFEAIITPVKLAMTPRVIPCRLEDVNGRIIIRPDLITLEGITATRKNGGAIAYSGTVPTGDKKDGVWDLALSAKDLVNDKELRQAVPPAVAKLLDALKLQGNLSLDLTKLTYRADPDPARDEGDLTFAGSIALVANSLEIGVPITNATGTITFDGAAKGGNLGGLVGKVALSTLTLGGREIKNFKCDLIKPASADALRIGKIAGEVAGGALAGQIDLIFPDKSPARFGLGLVLRNADVRELAGQNEKDIKGQLMASLAIEGNWGDPDSRRGRGDVSVSGKDMYKIPLLLGLMQITNLSLPISSPFNEAAARYTVEGEKVSFDQIELRASNMLMSGSGWLDFKSKRVKMTFVTDNPNAWRIPFISDILQGARQEFMQINVSGTVQEPKVSGSMMNSFTTTVDEVFKGDRKGEKR
jgi:hypothetical protein